MCIRDSPCLHRRGRDKQHSRKTNGGRALHQPPAHRHAPASRPYHQICLAGLRLAENYECPSGSRIPLQYLSQHRTTSRSHTHPLTHRAGCCAEPYETQLPLHAVSYTHLAICCPSAERTWSLLQFWANPVFISSGSAGEVGERR